jgi:hypothetical protein
VTSQAYPEVTAFRFLSELQAALAATFPAKFSLDKSAAVGDANGQDKKAVDAIVLPLCSKYLFTIQLHS